MAPTGYAAYNQAVVHTTDNKERILLMLYDGAVRFVSFARSGIENKNAKIKGENISKVMAIITELDCALDREMGGELVENLSNLYRYMMDRLTIANVKNDTSILDEVERLLLNLKEGFDEAGRKESAFQPAIEHAQMQGG
ncbi:MAG: flagellar export chaperone FliS, partial [Deltaproteobacteria bacterium]|nr:flagellar export chaperone FliS [Deltaproteobacteria bacterium]